MSEKDALLTRPKSIKALGVLHMVFGILAILMALFSLVMQPIMTKMYQGMAEGMEDDAARAQFEMQVKIQQETGHYNIIYNATLLILAVILVVAGVKLLKSKKNGRSLSVTWGWLAIGMTGVWLVMSFTMLMPKMPEIMESAMVHELDSSGASMTEEELDQMSAIMTTAMAIAFVVMSLLALIYPTVTIVLMSKKAVREWMEAHGT